jgi:hypothetical protein
MLVVSEDEEYGRLVLVLDKKTTCKDAAGNSFTRSLNSSYKLHYGMFNLSFFNFEVKLHKKAFRFSHSLVCKVKKFSVVTGEANVYNFYSTIFFQSIYSSFVYC